MASDFTVLSDHGVIETRKDNEFVKVQTVTAGGRTWMEARVNFVGRDGELRGTKTALTFDDIDDVTALIEALTEMRDAFQAPAAAPPKPNFEVRKPTVNTNGVAAKARAARAAQAKSQARSKKAAS